MVSNAPSSYHAQKSREARGPNSKPEGGSGCSRTGFLSQAPVTRTSPSLAREMWPSLATEVPDSSRRGVSPKVRADGLRFGKAWRVINRRIQGPAAIGLTPRLQENRRQIRLRPTSCASNACSRSYSVHSAAQRRRNMRCEQLHTSSAALASR